MKNKIYITIGVLTIIVFLTVFIPKRKTSIYLYLAGYEQFDRVPICLHIDGIEVFNDTVKYHPFNPVHIKYPMHFGRHKIVAQSMETVVEENVLLLYNQYISVGFYGSMHLIRDKPTFHINSQWEPYYFE